jgi:hypothetical protein
LGTKRSTAKRHRSAANALKKDITIATVLRLFQSVQYVGAPTKRLVGTALVGMALIGIALAGIAQPPTYNAMNKF